MRERQCSKMFHRLFRTCSCVGTSRAIVCVAKLLKVSSVQRRPSHVSNFRCKGGRGTALCGCNTGALIPTPPPTSSGAFGVNSLPSASSSKLPVHRSPAVPTGTVFDPASGPSTFLVQIVYPEGPDGGWMAAKASTTLVHRTVPRGEQRALRSCAVLRSRPNANRRCMLAAYGTSHVNILWSAGTSTPEADSTASLIDLTCPMTTFTELSAAPLDCGSPSADVSCSHQSRPASPLEY